MNFNSFDYFYFLTIVYFVYRVLAHRSTSQKNLFLLLASFVFYAWWSPGHVLLLVYSGITDYFLGKKIASSEEKAKRTKFLAISILNNLSVLFTFKYLSAFCVGINEWLGMTPMAFRLFEPDLILPVGISFYTFQTISYTFDIYRKHVDPLESRIDFMLYVAFFPQLVAGPILRAKQFVPQLTQGFNFESKRFFQGLFFLLYGLFKKNCIADPLGVYVVDPVYTDLQTQSSIDILLATYAYGFQLYNDFSGYSDMAIGSALILGFTIPINFDSPFLCKNSRDFWNRWHISLGHWVRDYVFYPFHGTKFFKTRIRLNLFATLVIIGAWHGPRWTYLWFGIFHGVLSVLHSKYGQNIPQFKGGMEKLWNLACWLIFWHLLCIGFWLFRANSMEEALLLADALFSFQGTSLINAPWVALGPVILLAILTHGLRAAKLEALSIKFAEASLLWKVLFCWVIFIACIHYEFFIQGRAAFIYFQF